MKMTGKMKTVKCWMMCLSGILLLTFSSCGDDDNANVGNNEVAELKAVLIDDEGQVAFDATATEGEYQIGLLSLDDARSLTALYAGQGFTGQAYTRRLADNKGTVQVTVGDNGVYYRVRFAVVGIPQFVLNLVDEGGNSFGVRHTCNVCGYKWISTINRCPRAGNKSYHP